MKKIAAFVAVCVLVFLAVGCADKEQAAETEKIKTRLTDQTIVIQSLEAKLDDLKVKIEQDGKTDSLIEEINTVKNDLRELTQAQADTMNKTEGLTALHALSMKVNEIADRVQTLTDRVSAEARKAETVVASSVQNLNLAPVRPKAVSEPPFLVVGIEYRGQEPFLAVVSKAGKALSDVKLLQPNDLATEGWRLKSLNASRAVFLVDGRDFAIELP